MIGRIFFLGWGGGVKLLDVIVLYSFNLNQFSTNRKVKYIKTFEFINYRNHKHPFVQLKE